MTGRLRRRLWLMLTVCCLSAALLTPPAALAAGDGVRINRALLIGVDDFVSNDNGVRRFSNCLSLANSGSVGSSFYEPFEFVASDHITHLKNEEFNKYHYLFLATVTSRLSQKYNFNREINDKRISREIILLPLNDKGEPDYEYMEKYSKNLLYEKIQMYIKYIENK